MSNQQTPAQDFETSVKVEFTLDGSNHKLFPDLLEEELFAIGRITVGFAYLENLILRDTVETVAKKRIDLPQDASPTSFKKRLRLWRKFIRKYRRGKPRERLLAIAQRISNCQQARNRITHGLWYWDYVTPDGATATSIKPSFQFTEHFDFEKLLKRGDEIAEINFGLSYPTGKMEAWKSLAQRGIGISRSFAHIAAGKPLPPSLVRERDSVVPSKTHPWES